MSKKILNGILPAILLTLPIGSVYAFSLSIFFLGMGAAFGGSIVEKNINKSAMLSTILFFIGLVTTSIGLYIKNIWFVYIGYGVLCGIAEGISYLTPVKTLLMWFPKHKGLATAISIVSFGLGSSFCTLLYKLFYAEVGIVLMFQILAGIYFVMMLIGGLMIKKPYKEADTKNTQNFSYMNIFKDKFFICSWLFMFFNISAGLSIIGSSVDILKEIKISSGMIIVLMTLAGIFNGSFRLIFAWISDYLKDRTNIWILISAIAILCMFSSFIYPLSFCIAILCINAVYGAGFSTIPSILAEKYDINCLSRVHGAVLSAWGIGGLVGNNISTLVYSLSGSFVYVPIILIFVYIINFIISLNLKQIK